jgi:serpin B
MMHQWNGLSASYGAFQSNGDLFPTPREIKFSLKDDDPSLYPDSQGHTMLALDYQGRKIQMVFLVPQSADGILDLEKSLTHENLQRWIGQLEKRVVILTIPKYSLKWKCELSETLRSLGMVRPFGGPEESQFDAVSPNQQPGNRFWISQVHHQTFIDVSEIGTEAAAATAVGGEVGDEAWEVKTRPFHPNFKANKPFIFLIRDRETASILFMGRYVGPTD